jgi:two-component system, NarL family, response regulator LiaR
MERTAEGHRSGYWGIIVFFGCVLAAMVVMLKYVEYRYWIRDFSVEVYVGVVATLFTALGVWMGSKLLNRQKPAPIEMPAPIDEEAIGRIGLSSRELEVLQLIAQGHSNQEIGDRLFISLPTVKSHSTKLFVKLDVKRRTEAVHKAKSLGIIG